MKWEGRTQVWESVFVLEQFTVQLDGAQNKAIVVFVSTCFYLALLGCTHIFFTYMYYIYIYI